MKSILRNAMLPAIALALSPGVHAAGEHGGHHGGDSIGEPGKAEDVSRTIDVTMLDNYYEPESISVKPGETIRFRVKNDGAMVHEFNIGTADMHEAHQEEMEMMVEHGVIKGDKIDEDMMKMDMGDGKTMEHDDPNSVLMEPGETREIIWTFTEATDLEFACNVPGHYQSGMYGDIDFE
ncbi:plastocyanin/azurin family copper-binding protein [Marinobacter sp. HL-58]|uniref:cupredoxin domain-containing protein n=1 Tax=Marinobacter sp. HL-58 TaxID=1479237 RepID=UPI00055AAEC1|nr:plastocyanin/azurin family copper-binding protein [Marinobacter sp. HL-58]KPQ03199.1 MAG: putative copper-binding protein [Marinobacter sp. HL-58]